MKIRTKEDVVKLQARVKDELGIYLEKYRKEEVIENFVELLIFPRYVATWVFRPVLISLMIFFIGFFLLDLVHIEYVIYGLIGFLLFLVAGFLFGLLYLTFKMKADLWGIVGYSLEIMDIAVNDLNQVGRNLTRAKRMDTLGLLFTGVTHVVTIPTMTQVVSERVPYIGGLVSKTIAKILTLISDKVKWDVEEIDREIDAEGNQGNILGMYSKAITAVSSRLEKVFNPIRALGFLVKIFLRCN